MLDNFGVVTTLPSDSEYVFKLLWKLDPILVCSDVESEARGDHLYQFAFAQSPPFQLDTCKNEESPLTTGCDTFVFELRILCQHVTLGSQEDLLFKLLMVKYETNYATFNRFVFRALTFDENMKVIADPVYQESMELTPAVLFNIPIKPLFYDNIEYPLLKPLNLEISFKPLYTGPRSPYGLFNDDEDYWN